MPIPPLVAAGIPLLGGAIQGLFNRGQNQSSQQFSLDMYNRQRADALADWNRVNAYNSPSEQMRRFKEAGLNPNLIYGQSNEAQSVRSSEAAKWTPRPYDITGPVTDSISNYINTKIQNQTLKNMELDATLKASENLLKQKQAANLDIKTSTSRYDLERAMANRDQLDLYIKLNNQKLAAGTQFTLDANERAIAMTASSLKEAAQRILESKARMATSAAQRQILQRQAKSLDYDIDLKRYDKELRDRGIDPRSPAWLKNLSNIMNRITGGGLPQDYPTLPDEPVLDDSGRFYKEWLKRQGGNRSRYDYRASD